MNMLEFGKTVNIPARTIEIYEVELERISTDDCIIEFIVHCSKGTYIRSLCENIAEKLGTVGFMKELERIKVGKFKIEESVKIEELEKNKDNLDFMKKHFISIEKFYEKELEIELNARKTELFLNGVNLSMNLENGNYRIYNENKFIGTGIIENRKLKRDIIICNLNK